MVPENAPNLFEKGIDGMEHRIQIPAANDYLYKKA